MSLHRHANGQESPRYGRFLIILLVTVGGIAAGAWLATREVPKAVASEDELRWEPDR